MVRVDSDSKNKLKEKREYSLSTEWAQLIRNQGTCSINAKVNPDIFSDTPISKVQPRKPEQDYDYPANGLGQIGYQYESTVMSARPSLSQISAELTDPQTLIHYKEKAKTLLILSAPNNPTDDYNQKQLNGKFPVSYQEIRLHTFIPENSHTTYRTQDGETPFQIILHLPAEAAKKLYLEMAMNRTEILPMLHQLYPNIGLLLTNKSTFSDLRPLAPQTNPQNAQEARQYLKEMFNED